MTKENLEKIDELFSIKRKITKEQFLELINNVKKGATISSECKKLNIAPATMSHFLSFCNLVIRKDHNLLPDNVKNEIIERFKNGEPMCKLQHEYGYEKNTLSKLIRSYGVDTMAPSFNINVFENIDNENAAYWLGFLCADGCVSASNNHIELALQESDFMHLEKFKKFLNSKNSITFKDSSKSCRISICNEKTKNDLIRHGCTPRKSLTLLFPVIDKSIVRHFVRGYFDGDGSLTHRFKNNKRKDSVVPSCSICGTPEFLNGICDNLDFLKSRKIYKSKSRTYTLMLNLQESIDFINYIYTDCSIYLDRKYEKYKIFKQYNFCRPIEQSIGLLRRKFEEA